ncbi:MAG: methyltransferase domain-containing protein [Gemmatimonadaceae bacterium]|nr:methyltransferase domain-containing protein [Gemmatimonadaceae bacterium]
MKKRDLPPELKNLYDRFTVLEESIAVGKHTFDIIRPRNADDLISEADYVKDERLPYWADIWPSSVVLGEWLLTHPSEERTLELGCGSGLVTTSAMKSGRSVTATDYYDDAVLFAKANSILSVGRSPEVRMVDWSSFPDDLGKFDLVLASDVLYEPRYPPMVANAIDRSLAPGGVAIVADPGRVAAPLFPAELESRNLRILKKETIPYSLNAISQKIDLYHIVRK